MNRSMLARDTAKNRDAINIQVQAQTRGQTKIRNRFDARDKIDKIEQIEQIDQIESEEQIELGVRFELTELTDQTETDQTETSYTNLPESNSRTLDLFEPSADHKNNAVNRNKFYVETIREIEHRLDTEIDRDGDNDIPHIDSYLLSLENRYTNQTPYKISNRLYAIGLDIAISSYTKHEVSKIIDDALQNAINEICESNAPDAQDTPNTLDEVRAYYFKRLMTYIKKGVEDGSSPIYSDTYRSAYSGTHYQHTESDKAITTHLGSMFVKYTDSADPRDIEQMYDIGILISSIPFDQTKMISKLKPIIEQKSADPIEKIRRNKREQMLQSMDRGYANASNQKIRDAYDLEGGYNYLNKPDLLKKRARIDGTIKRTTVKRKSKAKARPIIV